MITFNKFLGQVYVEKLGISKEDVQKRFSRKKRLYVVLLSYTALLLRSKKVGVYIAKIFVKECERIVEELRFECMDYSGVCREIKEGCKNPHMLEKNYKFFYDETNNYRVFHIKDGDFNESPTKYFVLGGVCYENQTRPAFSKIESSLRLQPNMTEIKARHIFRKKQFVERLKEKKLNVILKWLEEENCFLHMVAVDHLEVIVNIIAGMCVHGEENDGDRILLRETLYRSAKRSMKSFGKILAKYDFPNVNEKRWGLFCGELICFLTIAGLRERSVDAIDKLGNKILFEYPIGILKNAKTYQLKNDLGDKIIENYGMYYLCKPLTFINSSHVYDLEPEIREKMKAETIYVEGKVLKNYSFMDSKDNRMIQISDVVVSLLASFLKYVNSFEVGRKTAESVQKINTTIKEPLERENFCLLMKLLRRSEEENECFLHVYADHVNMNAFSLLKSVTKITDEAVSFMSFCSGESKIISKGEEDVLY